MIYRFRISKRIATTTYPAVLALAPIRCVRGASKLCLATGTGSASQCSVNHGSPTASTVSTLRSLKTSSAMLNLLQCGYLYRNKVKILHPLGGGRLLHNTHINHMNHNKNPSGIVENRERELDTEDILDTHYKETFADTYLNPTHGHRVFVIQPDVKYLKLSSEERTVRAELSLLEASALVDSLPQWSVVTSAVATQKSHNDSSVFSSGVFRYLVDEVRDTPNITAVFINIGMLSSIQLARLQDAFHLPVYDRFTLVLQIFRIRARTKEAKLQVALAEIPYLSARLRGMHDGTLYYQQGELHYMGGTGESYFEMRSRTLAERQQKLQKQLELMKQHRKVQRQERQTRQVPVVAIVGYTNAGKTSLIKALTSSTSLQPRDKLFATLDAVTYSGQLGNHMKIVYLDTVGFISDIPTSLIASFGAVLEEIEAADVIVHVQDISHPDMGMQVAHVNDTLNSLRLPSSLLTNVIEVANKCDLEDTNAMLTSLDNSCLRISTKTGDGLHELLQKIEDTVIRNTGRLRKKFKIPLNGSHLSWLYKESSVEKTEICDTDMNSIFVDVVMTNAAYAKFVRRFGKRKKKNPTS